MEYDCWGWVGVECKLGLTVGVKVLVFSVMTSKRCTLCLF